MRLVTFICQTVKGSIYQRSPNIKVVLNDWSTCSVSCGNGRLSRVVTCTYLQENKSYTCTSQKGCWIRRCVGKCKYETCVRFKLYWRSKHTSIATYVPYHITCTMNILWFMFLLKLLFCLDNYSILYN